jgi:hypothetical protein
MRGKLIAMGMRMSVVPGRKLRLDLGMVRGVRMWVIHGMMLIRFALPVFIRAGLGSGLRGLGIIRLAVRSVSWRHSH